MLANFASSLLCRFANFASTMLCRFANFASTLLSKLASFPPSVLSRCARSSRDAAELAIASFKALACSSACADGTPVASSLFA